MKNNQRQLIESRRDYVDYDTAIASLKEIIARDWIPDEIPEDPFSLVESK